MTVPRLALLLFLLSYVAAALSPAFAQETTERVSVSSGGAEANRDSWAPSISADGRYVAFCSEARNLVEGDNNRSFDIFVRDRLAGTTERVSVSSAGAEGNRSSHSPSISADGRYVAFASAARNLVEGDNNRHSDIFVRDRLAGTIERVSVSSGGAEANRDSWAPFISADGRYVAFWSEARNLVEGDNNRNVDIFVRDRLAGTTERVSVSSAGAEGNGDSGGYPIEANVPSISADGRHVAFSSEATNLVAGGKRRHWWNIPDPELHVFVRDRLAGTTERVSVSSAGAKGNDRSDDPSISADGRYVAFASAARNLVEGDNNRHSDIFVRDRVAGTTERVSISSAGAEAWDDCSSPSISADGRYVAFSSEAENLVPGGRKLWWGIPGENLQIFVRDRLAGTTERVSVSSAGAKGNSGSRHPSISADGRYVGFDCSASNLVAGDGNNCHDVFVHDRLPHPVPEVLLQVHPKELAPEESKNR